LTPPAQPPSSAQQFRSTLLLTPQGNEEWSGVLGGLSSGPVYQVGSAHLQFSLARFSRYYPMRNPFSRRLWMAAFAFAALMATGVQAQDDKDSSKYTNLVKDAKVQSGLIKLIQKDGKLYAELTPGNLNKD